MDKAKYWPRFLPPGYFDLLRDGIAWEQRTIKLYGKETPLPRLTAWYGDADMVYTYSGIANTPHQWTRLLKHLKSTVEQATGYEFNSALLNYYRDGKDSIGWHADDEPELGPSPVIASLSFGGSRAFMLRDAHTKQLAGKYELSDGSLLLMMPGCQEAYEHSLPKRAHAEPRINVTFRRLVK